VLSPRQNEGVELEIEDVKQRSVADPALEIKLIR
jgi:hypothetical protein